MINDDDIYIFCCPHCLEDIVVIKKELNCRIFRHGILKATYQQIDPHAPFEVCDRLAKNDLIYGCGKPFEVINQTKDILVAVKCDYK